MVNLKALEAAIAKVENIRAFEYTFEVGDIQITLRPLLPFEETEMTRYAEVAMEGVKEGASTQAAFADFMDRLRHATLGFSIVELGELDLRKVEYLETGEVDDQQRPILVPKWEAIRDMVASQWTRFMLSEVFSRFGELLERLEANARKSVKFDPVDLQEEIERHERRLTELRALKLKSEEVPDGDLALRQQNLVKQAQKAQQDQRESLRQAQRRDVGQDLAETIEPEPGSGQAPPTSAPATPSSPPVPPAASAPPEASQGRRSAIPTAAPEAAPARHETPAPSPAESPDLDDDTRFDQQGIPRPLEGDSFFDPADPDAALAAESARQGELHRRHIQRQQEQAARRAAAEAAGMPDPATVARDITRDTQRSSSTPRGATRLDARTDGLRAAANANDAVFDGNANQIRSGRPISRPRPPERPGQPALLHGKPVYKMSQTQILDRPARERAAEAPAPAVSATINPEGGHARNQKFRGPGET
jgi:hypothetical protein